MKSAIRWMAGKDKHTFLWLMGYLYVENNNNGKKFQLSMITDFAELFLESSETFALPNEVRIIGSGNDTHIVGDGGLLEALYDAIMFRALKQVYPEKIEDMLKVIT